MFFYLIFKVVRTSRNTFQVENGVSNFSIIILNVSLNVLNVSLNVFCSYSFCCLEFLLFQETDFQAFRLSDLPIIILANSAALVLPNLKSFSN